MFFKAKKLQKTKKYLNKNPSMFLRLKEISFCFKAKNVKKPNKILQCFLKPKNFKKPRRT